MIMPYYNSYQPTYFGNNNPYYFPQMQLQNQQNQMMAQQQQAQVQQQTIQQSGFVLVQSEQEARAYPVAPGNSITFKDESQPYCYVKTMGFNQLDRPTFERYRLVKEEEVTPLPQAQGPAKSEVEYALKSDLDDLWEELKKLKSQAKKIVKKEENDDDE